MSDLREKYGKSIASDAVIVPPDGVAIKECFYGNLTVLDAKASALMAFDVILVAVASFTVQTAGVLERQRLPLIVIIMTLIASGLCLLAAQISYPFLGKVIVQPGPPVTLDYSNEIKALNGAVDLRTCLYRFAWLLSVIAVGLFLGMFTWALVSQP